MKSVTVKYNCDQCGKDPHQCDGPLIVSFGCADDVENNGPPSPGQIEVCNWECAALWIIKRKMGSQWRLTNRGKSRATGERA